MSNVTVSEARMMTNQEFFNRVWERAKNPIRSVNKEGGLCRYRASNGTECFVGCCIPDEDYDSRYDAPFTEEGTQFTLSHLMCALLPYVNIRLAQQCQSIHDNTDPKYWFEELRTIARKHGLEIPK